MTQPEPAPAIDGPPVPDDESLAFEIAAVAAVTAAVAASVGAVLGLAFTAYAAGATGAGLAAELASRLRGLRWAPMRPALRKVAMDARDLGVRRAGPPFPRSIELGDLPDPDRAVADALRDASRLAQLLPMTTKRDLHAVQGRANQGLATARGHARWTANEGINAGVSEVARARGERLIWVAERNACLHCLAHAGYAVEPGDLFPIVSYDPIRPDAMPAVAWPPLHPNCRCAVRTYTGSAGRPPSDRSAPDPAARLAAEARRSVVYQWTDYASGTRARAAAGRLLDVGASLPDSVERRARRALRTDSRVKRPT